jgi:hypothetical protein
VTRAVAPGGRSSSRRPTAIAYEYIAVPRQKHRRALHEKRLAELLLWTRSGYSLRMECSGSGRDTAWAMWEENVEIVRRLFAREELQLGDGSRRDRRQRIGSTTPGLHAKLGLPLECVASRPRADSCTTACWEPRSTAKASRSAPAGAASERWSGAGSYRNRAWVRRPASRRSPAARAG